MSATLHKTYLLLLFFLLTPVAAAQNYLWPTDASNHLTSSFCEYRPGHYHSAIDIKTWNQEGFKCFAVEDGFIEKVRVSPFGYGKVIYVRLKDGNTAVYAHLQRFNKQIEAEIHKLQMKRQRYSVTWRPKNRRVKKGDVLAYTGRTGIGTPHLHFEIRNWKGNPVNPLLYYPKFVDKIRPRLQKLAVLPITASSRVNGSALPKIFDLVYIRDRVYFVREPILVQGKIGLALKGYDQADGVYNKFAFYSTSLAVNTRPVFRITYRELDFSLTGFIEQEIYYPFRADYREVFHKLFIEPFNLLEFYDDIPNETGVIAIGKKPVDFRIEVTDFHGNLSIIKGELLPDYHPQIEIKSLEKKGDWAYVHFSAEPFTEMYFATAGVGENFQPSRYFEVISQQATDVRKSIYTRIKLPDSTDTQLKIGLGSDADNSFSRIIPIISAQDSIPPIEPPQIIFAGNRLVLTSPYPLEGMASQIGGKFIPLAFNYVSDNYHEAVLPVSRLADAPLRFNLEYAGENVWQDTLRFFKIIPGEKRAKVWYDSALVMFSNTQSAYDTTLLTVRKSTADSLARFFQVQGSVYEVHPQNIALWKGINAHLKAAGTGMNGNWAVYTTNGRDHLSFVSAKFDSATGYFNFKIYKPGNYIIASDTLAPQISVDSPRPGKTYHRNPKIRFTVSDSLSGIGSDSNLQVSLNSNFVLAEWDPEDDLVTAKIDSPLAAGDYELLISVRDIAGNRTERTILFSIR